MMYFTRMSFAGILLFFHIVFLQAQVGFNLPEYNNLVLNQLVNVPVTVQNFDSVVSMQFVVRWDPTVVQFIDINTFGLPQMNADNFGITQALDSGLLRVVWWHSGDGVTLADGETAFKVRFKVIGAANSFSNLTFTQIVPTTFFEVVENNGTNFNINTAMLSNGFMAVGYTVDTQDAAAAAGSHITMGPNPVQDNTRIWVELERAEEVTLQLLDSSGRIIYFEKKWLLPGKHGMEIASHLKEQKGTYFLVVHTASATRVFSLLSI